MRPHHSYANVASTLALVVALGGTGAYAAGLAKNSVGSKQIKNGAIKAKDVKPNGLTGAQVDEATLTKVPAALSADTAIRAGNVLGAQVLPDGSLVRGRGVVGSTRLSAGEYRVQFDRELAGCIYSGALVSPNTSAQAVGWIAVALDASSPGGLAVQTYEAVGFAQDNADFSLIVVC